MKTDSIDSNSDWYKNKIKEISSMLDEVLNIVEENNKAYYITIVDDKLSYHEGLGKFNKEFLVVLFPDRDIEFIRNNKYFFVKEILDTWLYKNLKVNANW
jgi:hypothetical protein